MISNINDLVSQIQDDSAVALKSSHDEKIKKFDDLKYLT